MAVSVSLLCLLKNNNISSHVLWDFPSPNHSNIEYSISGASRSSLTRISKTLLTWLCLWFSLCCSVIELRLIICSGCFLAHLLKLRKLEEMAWIPVLQCIQRRSCYDVSLFLVATGTMSVSGHSVSLRYVDDCCMFWDFFNQSQSYIGTSLLSLKIPILFQINTTTSDVSVFLRDVQYLPSVCRNLPAISNLENLFFCATLKGSQEWMMFVSGRNPSNVAMSILCLKILFLYQNIDRFNSCFCCSLRYRIFTIYMGNIVIYL